jgi:hypothetical protein
MHNKYQPDTLVKRELYRDDMKFFKLLSDDDIPSMTVALKGPVRPYEFLSTFDHKKSFICAPE